MKRKVLPICMMIITTILLGLIFGTMIVPAKEHGEQKLLTGWNAVVNGQEFNNVTMEELAFPLVPIDSEITLWCKLPQDAIENPVLWFHTVHTTMDVWVDGELIYSYGHENYKNREVVGYGYHFIDMPEDYAGKELRIKQTVTENESFTNYKIPSIKVADYMHMDFFIENIIAYAVLFFLVVFGVCVLVITLVFSMKGGNFMQLVCISMFSITIAVWSICNNDLICIMNYGLRTKAYLEFISIYLTPCFVFGYFASANMQKGSKTRQIVYWSILGTQIVFSGLALLLQGLRVIRFPQVLSFSHFLLAVMFLFVFVTMLQDMILRKMTNYTLFIGMIVLLFFAGGDLILFNLQRTWEFMYSFRFGGHLHIGLLIFVITLIVDFCKDLYGGMRETIERETLERMAYTDNLTGLYNRHRFETIFDEIDKKSTPFTLVSFDLNELKMINDTYGHDEGDVYIKAFSNLLRKLFEKYGDIGRMGGDEFLVVMQKRKMREVEALMVLFQEELDLANHEEHTLWQMSVAWGISGSEEAAVMSIREACKLADNRMYKKKTEMKEGEQDEITN